MPQTGFRYIGGAVGLGRARPRRPPIPRRPRERLGRRAWPPWPGGCWLGAGARARGLRKKKTKKKGTKQKQSRMQAKNNRPTSPFLFVCGLGPLCASAVDMPPHVGTRRQLAGCGVFLYKPVPSGDPFISSLFF
jgi:hypothetical protein